ncbi:uncharacterized mitochondrial protein AtMg00860-like [Benincasa hispida]|uniref:uncharacterized mitochondrial protein AtMg00860-like n=1 Tax=Benincasa hispida TaxID=102211 RepID=UPI0019029FC2|nr:uncharacterized mitochondrial protein AtMg00860-like [Benincasa hispida]
MVNEGIVLEHKVSKEGLEVDNAKIEAIEKLPPPANMNAVRIFLGHAGIYRRFVKDFSKIARPLSALLEADKTFDFDVQCLNAFKLLKNALITASILIALDWTKPCELMCDGGCVSMEGKDNATPHRICEQNIELRPGKLHTTEKELLAMIFVLEKFRAYLLGSKEFDMEIIDRKGMENQVADTYRD